MKWFEKELFKKFIVIFGLCFVFLNYNAFSLEALSAGKSGISGFVKDASSKETIIGATVYLKGTKYGTKTNKSGFYSVTNVEPGEYTLIVSSIGFEKIEKKIILSADNYIRDNIELK